MNAGDKRIVLILAIAIAAVAVVAVLSIPKASVPDPVQPDIPEPQPDPEPSLYPEGISFDLRTGTLTSDKDITWEVTDQLVEHIDKETVEHSGKELQLPQGYFKVSAKGQTFDVIVDGTVERSYDWKYLYKGQSYDIHVSLSIDIAELAEIMIENREFNDSRKLTFEDLPNGVYVDETVIDVVSQLEKRFREIGGSPDNRQEYADFLASFAQLGIVYPHRDYTWTDAYGNPVYVEAWDGTMVPKESTDYEVWGCDEYWANTLETMFFGIGDCDDSAAVACALFEAAGYRTAMLGAYSHVAAGVELDSFTEVDEKYLKQFIAHPRNVFSGPSSTEGDDTIYYAVETTKGQAYVGYFGNKVTILGEPTFHGNNGFYSVPLSYG
jgi:hypothetical protein